MQNIGDYERAKEMLESIRDSRWFKEDIDDGTREFLLERFRPAKGVLEEVIEFLRENCTLERLVRKQK